MEITRDQLNTDKEHREEKKKTLTSELDPKKEGTPREVPRVYDYLDYKDYLKDYYQYNKSKNPKFSYGTFANKGKFQTRNYLKRVMDGERSITSENFPKFCLALGFSAKESQYFEALVNLNQAKDDFSKKYYFDHLRSSSLGVKNSAIEVAANQYDMFAKWYIIPVLEALSLTNIDHIPESISKILRKKVSIKEVKDALFILEKVGLVKYNEAQKRYVKSAEKIRYTQNGINLAARDFHKQTLSNVIEFIDNEPLEARYLRSLTIALNPKHLTEVYQEIDLLIKRLNDKYSDLKNEKDMIMQLNLNVLNLTKDS